MTNWSRKLKSDHFIVSSYSKSFINFDIYISLLLPNIIGPPTFILVLADHPPVARAVNGDQPPCRPLFGEKARDAVKRPIKTFRPKRRPRQGVGSYGITPHARRPDTKISTNPIQMKVLTPIIFEGNINIRLTKT